MRLIELKTQALLVIFLLSSLMFGVHAESPLVIGTGSVAGVYYPTGGAICRFYERSAFGAEPCIVESTGGSLDNLAGLRSGRYSLAVVQSDSQYFAYTGRSEYPEEATFNELRSLFSLHSEPFTVLARSDAGISSFRDLQGRRVNIGEPGSGQRSTFEVLMSAYGWTLNDFQRTTELPPLRQAEALCDYRADAITYAVGHPNPALLEATELCDSVLVTVAGAEIDQLLDEKPYYRMARIPGGLYPGNPDPVQTFGVAATVVTTADMSDELAYQLVKAVFENFDTLTRLHPAFSGLDPSTMVQDGLTAPLHPGARNYYEEAGLL